MRRLGLILTAALAACLLIAAFSVLGGFDPRIRRKASPANPGTVRSLDKHAQRGVNSAKEPAHSVDGLAPHKAIPANEPAPGLDAEKPEASPVVGPVKLPSAPAAEAVPASFAPSPEASLAQSTVAPPTASDAPAARPGLENEPAPAAPTPEPALAPAPATAPEGMIQVAAATAPLPALDPAHIPAIVTKLTPAKVLFAAATAPANMATRSIGFYAKGCLAGAKPLAVNGPAWQAMRLSRNRIWGHPSLIKYIERFAKDAKAKDGWPGLLVGDLSMPRGGPMPFGHSSHQVGLDVDIWYRPMPERHLTDEEREKIPMETFLADRGHVNPKVWTPDYVKLLRRSVSYPEVARIFVNPAIKKWLCDNVKDDRAFLRKITPIMGHDDHFHVRLFCPADNPGCRNQAELPADEGCGKGLDNWIAQLLKPAAPPKTPAAPGAPKAPAARVTSTPAPVVPVASKPSPAPAKPGAAAKPGTPAKPGTAAKPKGKTAITLADLPPECQAVLNAPALAATAQ